MRKIMSGEWLVASGWKILLIILILQITACMQLDTAEATSSSSSSYSSSSSSSNFNSSSSIPIRQISPTRLDTIGISFYEAILICNKMSIKEGLDTLYQYDQLLPTDDPSFFWLSNIKVLEGLSGYRLPTKEEWLQAKENGEINDANPTFGEWIYREANSQYSAFDIAPDFIRVVGLYRESSGRPAYGMRVLKIH